MSRQLGAMGALTGGIRATFASLPVVIPAVLAMGTLSAIGDRLTLSMLAASGKQAMVSKVLSGATLGQAETLTVALSWEGMSLIVEILAGPLLAAVAVYVGRLWSHGEPRSLYGAINFALNRYRKVFWPHAGAQVSIRVGMLVIVPGILFLLQYAFVDAVACLEQEDWPMSRSKKLTRGRRRRIFWVFLPFLVISQVIVFADFWALEVGAWMLALVHSGELLISFMMITAFYLLYESRVTPAEALPSPADDA